MKKIRLLRRKDTTFRSQAIGLQFYLTCLRFYLTCLEIYLTCLEFYPAYSFFYPINQRSHAESIPKSEGHPAQAECPSLISKTVFYVINNLLSRLYQCNLFIPKASRVVTFGSKAVIIFRRIWVFFHDTESAIPVAIRSPTTVICSSTDSSHQRC